MIELRQVTGPLDEEQLGWIARLYGAVDAKYGSLDYVRHQFVGNPFGWSAHVFAVADGVAVGHCGVIPFHARMGDEALVVGKLEALVVAPEFRGRTPSGGSVAIDLLESLYAFALDSGLPVLFGLAPPRVARIHVRAGCSLVSVDAPAYVLVSDARSFSRADPSRRRRILVAGLATAQNLVLLLAELTARSLTASWHAARVSGPTSADLELVVARPAGGGWTISGSDAWEWYRGSGVLQAIEVAGRYGARAIIRLDESDETTIQIVAWRARRRGIVPAVLLLGAVARLARRRSAPTVRFQPWHGSGGNGALARACRTFGFVRRPEAGLLLNSREALYTESPVQLTPFFYVTF